MVIPVLPPKSDELVAVKVAPPVKAINLREAQLIVGEPVATLIVDTAPPLVDEIENGVEEPPAQVKAFVIARVWPLLKVKSLGEARIRVPIVAVPVACKNVVKPFVTAANVMVA